MPKVIFPVGGGGGGGSGLEPLEANVARLDAVNGNDATGQVGTGLAYQTMQAAVNACKAAHDALGPVDSAARFRSGWVIQVAPFTSYDEDVTIDVTNGFHLQITGKAGWMLGVFDAINWAPNAGSNRSITITGDSRAFDATIDIRPSVIIGSLDETPYFGTNHLAWYGPRIAGQIKIDLVTAGGPLSGHCEIGLNCEIFGNTFAECIDMTGKNPIITLQFVNSRFRKAANFGTASNIFGAIRSRFTGLLTCNTWASFELCRFQAGFTTTGAVAAFPPAGLFNCFCSGPFTGPVGPNLRIDLASNTTLVETGAAVVGWSKVLLGVPAFYQGGNSFGALATLGTNDAFDVAFETNNVERARITTGGALLIGAVAPFAAEKLRVVGDARIEGKLTVTGVIDPTALILSDPLLGTALYFESFPGQTAPVSGATTGRLRYNDGTATWQVSMQGSAYVDLLTTATPGFVQNGNSFGAAAVLGTNDAFTLSFETNAITRMTIDTAGRVLPPADDSGEIGMDGQRWSRIRAKNIVSGDIGFDDPGCPYCGANFAIGERIVLEVRLLEYDRDGRQVTFTVPVHARCESAR